MIIWRGAGILVPVVAFGCLLVAQLLCNHVSGTPTYWQSRSWPVAAALLGAAAVLWVIGRLLERRSERVLIDPNTGREVHLHSAHDFFFIPMKYCGSILVVLAVVVLVTNKTPGPPRVRASEGSSAEARDEMKRGQASDPAPGRLRRGGG